jgi:hypothetical protein
MSLMPSSLRRVSSLSVGKPRTSFIHVERSDVQRVKLDASEAARSSVLPGIALSKGPHNHGVAFTCAAHPGLRARIGRLRVLI